MKTKTLKRLFLGLFLLAFILTGFIREFVFVNINYQLSYLYYHDEYNWVNKHLDFIKSFSYMQLYQAKWVLTFVFSIIYLALSCWLTHFLFKKRRFIKIMIGVFSLFGIIAILAYCTGYLLHDTASGYKFARIFMGIVQSPLIPMILMPAFVFSESKKTTPHS